MKNYEEVYCKMMIEFFYPELLFDKSEAPDWIDKSNDIGLECTIVSIGEEISTQYKYAELINHPEKIRNIEKRIKELNHQGCLTNFGFIGNSREETEENDWFYFEKGLKCKTDKLNKDYSKYKSNRLAFYCSDTLTKEILKAFSLRFATFTEEHNSSITFDTIYICAGGLELWTYDLKECKYRCFKIDNQYEFAKKVKNKQDEINLDL